MDSWKHLSGETGVWLSEELGLPADDGHGRFNSKEIGYEIKPFSNVESCPLVSNTQALERLDFMDLGFSDEMRKSYLISTKPSGEVFSGDQISTDSYGNLVSPFCEERESGSRFSTDFMQSNSQDFSLIDLKLGRLADGGGVLASSKPSPSSVPSLTGKRIRSTTLYPQSTCCLVLGCNKDLSSFKSYYKRHKVCDVHTKTAKVIVDGIEQRFCQQCSRFHLLTEFDDGKRSCRRRLAAHNRRRRKLQLNSEPETCIAGISSSFSFQDVLPSVIIGSGERMDHNFPACVKEDIEQSSRALSLLSAPSDNMQFGAAISKLSSHADSHTVDHTAGFFRKITKSGPHKPGIYSMEGDQVDPTTNNPRDGNIILDLLQLSSHLHRIEQQRDSTESEAG